MSTKTKQVSKERLDQIKHHQEWAAQQEAIVHTLATYVEGCLLYVPAATQATTGEFDQEWTVTRAVLVPEQHCVDAVVIPADHVTVVVANDHGKAVTVGPDTLAPDRRRRRFVTLSPDLEIALPGGKTAHLRKTGTGYTVDEDDSLPGPGSTTEETTP